MKKIITLFIIVPLLVSNSFAQKDKSSRSNPKSKVALETVLNELKKVTDEISNISSLDGQFEVSIKLNDVIANESGVKFSVLFFSFNKSRKKTIDNSFTTKYKFQVGKSDSAKGFTIKFAEYINEQIQAYVNSYSGELIKNGFSINTSFTIEKSGGLSGSDIELKPITFGFNAKRNKKSIHSVTIEYKPTKSIDSSDALKKSIELNEKSSELINTANKLLEAVKNKTDEN